MRNKLNFDRTNLRTRPPQFVILDLNQLEEMDKRNHPIFQRLPVKLVVQTFASIPIDKDLSDEGCNEQLWALIESCFIDIIDQLTESDYIAIQLYFDLLMEIYYRILRDTLGDMCDDYVFHSWINDSDYSCKLILDLSD